MIDSAVGGKTGINHRAGKNLIGAFHQPALVVADLETLTTLPRREWNAGWHEAIKYGVIRDADLFARLEARLPLALNQPLPWDWLAAVVADCCRIKAAIVARDERETGERKVLNFGHTVGHALEAVTCYRRFRHGEAVGIGMVAASQIAVRLGKLAPDEAQRLEQLVRRVGRMPGTDGLTVADLLEALRHDKKKFPRDSFVSSCRPASALPRNTVVRWKTCSRRRWRIHSPDSHGVSRETDCCRRLKAALKAENRKGAESPVRKPLLPTCCPHVSGCRQ